MEEDLWVKILGSFVALFLITAGLLGYFTYEYMKKEKEDNKNKPKAKPVCEDIINKITEEVNLEVSDLNLPLESIIVNISKGSTNVDLYSNETLLDKKEYIMLSSTNNNITVMTAIYPSKVGEILSCNIFTKCQNKDTYETLTTIYSKYQDTTHNNVEIRDKNSSQKLNTLQNINSLGNYFEQVFLYGKFGDINPNVYFPKTISFQNISNNSYIDYSLINSRTQYNFLYNEYSVKNSKSGLFEVIDTVDTEDNKEAYQGKMYEKKSLDIFDFLGYPIFYVSSSKK